jgi:hypothetical protein
MIIPGPINFPHHERIVTSTGFAKEQPLIDIALRDYPLSIGSSLVISNHGDYSG